MGATPKNEPQIIGFQHCQKDSFGSYRHGRQPKKEKKHHQNALHKCQDRNKCTTRCLTIQTTTLTLSWVSNATTNNNFAIQQCEKHNFGSSRRRGGHASIRSKRGSHDGLDAWWVWGCWEQLKQEGTRKDRLCSGVLHCGLRRFRDPVLVSISALLFITLQLGLAHVWRASRPIQPVRCLLASSHQAFCHRSGNVDHLESGVGCLGCQSIGFFGICLQVLNTWFPGYLHSDKYFLIMSTCRIYVYIDGIYCYYLSIYLSLYLSICLSIYLSIYLSI